MSDYHTLVGPGRASAHIDTALVYRPDVQPFNGEWMPAMSCFCLSWGQALAVAGAVSGNRSRVVGKHERWVTGRLPQRALFLEPNVRARVDADLSKWEGHLNSYHQKHRRGLPGPAPRMDRYLTAFAYS